MSDDATTRAQDARASHLARVLHAYRHGQEHELEPSSRAWAKPLQLIGLVARESTRDRTLRQAAALAFVSVLSIIPLLSVVTALLGAWGIFEPGNQDVVHYLELLFPASGGQIAVYLRDFSSKGAASIGGLNGVMLLVISILLFNSIERAITDIWRGAHDRPLVSKFIMFYTLLTLGPTLLMLSVLQSARAQIFIASRIGLDTGFMDALIPIGAAIVVFTLMNKILPNARVSWRSAALAGVTTALGFELAKWGFNQYVNLVIIDSYNRLYGTLGLAPIFMAWVYVTWSVILLGAELAYCHQHFTQLIRTDAPLHTLFKGGHAERQVLDQLAPLAIFAPIASSWAAGDGKVSEATLRHETGLPPALVRATVDTLLRRGHLTLAGRGSGNARLLLPSRALEQIALTDILSGLSVPPVGEPLTPLGELRQSHAAALSELLGERTALDLVDLETHTKLTEQIKALHLSEDEDLLDEAFATD